MSDSRREVIVVGCGVSGLSSGIRLLESGFDVRIVARELPPHTTSDVAAAIWYPYLAAPAERVMRWAERSYSAFSALSADPDTGVSLVSLRVLVRGGAGEAWWSDPTYRRTGLDADERPRGYAHAFRVEVPLVETPLYMRWLLRRFESLGGRITSGSIADLAELGHRVVVNCSGLGARSLAHDPAVHPIRGQVVRVRPQRQLHSHIADDSDPHHPVYVLSRRDDCVLGGTAEVGSGDCTPDPDTTQAILAACSEIEPRLVGATLIGAAVGLRPGRDAVRVEAQHEGASTVVHNYGHGGSGFTLSWGCAEEVVGLVRAAAP